uniref:Succinoglycan biosynthesis protein ExoA n=2 Tax=Candidatus Bipolaricaulota TaxID=67810 RepID=H5SG71_9BACT|nr:succinoglycan biosynthesis protein ExoA [uncultured Acetothermia bacterium]BAL55157.1 succinoglycan biosynthesis protein ExoA [uncultured Acetothermia bacterium]BAL60196.1 succinoglycan biosynthesis protein ExoA [Candidatus Acetothermum autotrophicum]
MLNEPHAALKRVSILIPTYNEEHYIAGCLDSILRNDYPQNLLEILVIDGGSTDGTKEIVRSYVERYHFIRLLTNPKRIQAAAMNIGIREATGEIIIWMSAHAFYASDYIRQSVTLLQQVDAACVGGLMVATGSGYISNSIAIAITSPFGSGDARYRYSDREEWVDTVFAGCWYKRTLEAIGGFNEEWVVNEDYELNYRLRQAGGRILFSPKIRCQYFVRSSLRALARQYFRYGFWKVKTLVTYPDSLRWRQLVPPLFALALITSLMLIPISWAAGIVIPILYGAANLMASLQAARRCGWKYLPLLPAVFTTLHLSWGIGFWSGMVRFGIPRFSWRSVARAFRSHY